MAGANASAPGVAIVGAGPVGLALALALDRQGVAAQVFDARTPAARLEDGRVLALSHGSRQTLEWLGAWNDPAATPIREIHVSQRGNFGRTLISAADQGLPALGYVVPAAALIATLQQAADQRGIPTFNETHIKRVEVSGQHAGLHDDDREYAAALVAYAEGGISGESGIVVRDYGQHAIVCSVVAGQAHHNQAWERFTAQGPVALLPQGPNYALVLTCASTQSAELAALDDAAFLAGLQERFGGRISFVSAGPRRVFPLGLRYRRSAVGPRQAWLGNAAQTLHPVAGQGFNLALRDVFELAAILRDAPDPGNAALLSRYAARRRFDRRGAIGATDLLVKLFSNNHPLLRHARGLGLLSLDLLPPARSFLSRRMMFGARAWP